MRQQFTTVAVVGGGASGIIAALTAAEVSGRHVLLLEHQQRIGRKLLATGNGRCNLTNQNASPTDYFGRDPAFAEYALSHFGPVDAQRFFSRIGLLTVTEPGGRVYPFSDSSNSVLDVLRFALDDPRIQLYTGCTVTGIRVKDHSFTVQTEQDSFTADGIIPRGKAYLLKSGNEALLADAVILACGGAAGAKLGGVMDGYRLGKALGHRRTSLYPSLTRILTASDYPRSLKGVRVQASLRLMRGDHLLAESAGEVQFTENGVSGPAGFDLSRAVSFGGEGQVLHLKLLPFESEGILSLVHARQKQFPELEASELFTGMLHNRLGRVLVKAAGIPATVPLKTLTPEDLRTAARKCEDFCLPVRGTDGFDAAQVTAGGLITDDFDPKTMQSRLHPGLYACGELLDIDGPCGGYNLQWAWASGRLAGRLGT